MGDEKEKKEEKERGWKAPWWVGPACMGALSSLVGGIMVAQGVMERRGVEKETPTAGDVLMASFPKSGSNWVRHLVVGLELARFEEARPSMRGKLKLTFSLAEDLVPDLEFGPNRQKFEKNNTKVAWKSHQPYLENHRAAGVGPADAHSKGSPRCTEALVNVNQFQCFCPNCPIRWQRFVYVVRDGRSALCSYYHFQKQLGNTDAELTFEEFLASDESKYGVSWADHVLSYLDVPRDVLILKYEALHDDPHAELAKLAQFLGRDYSPDAVAKAVDLASFSVMRSSEDVHGTPLFDTLYPDRSPDFKLVREGKVDGWRSCVDDEHAANLLFRRHVPRFDQAMMRLGYFSPLSSSPPSNL